MKTIKIKKGLDIPIDGVPENVVRSSGKTAEYALLGEDYKGLKPRILVKEGDSVKKGSVLFVHKKDERIKFTSPASGIVKSINRGEKRRFLSIIVEKDSEDTVSFDKYSNFSEIPKEEIIQQMLDSGVWTSLVARPYGKLADPDVTPKDIFVTAADTRPLSPDPDIMIEKENNNLFDGVRILSRLTEGKVFVCFGGDTKAEIPDNLPENVEAVSFQGPHPSGLAGTHIHFLSHASRNRLIWQISYQDAIAVGRLFNNGELYTKRIISVAGEMVQNPCLIETDIGVNIDSIISSHLKEGSVRLISGSPLFGRTCRESTNFLGRFDFQVSAIPEGGERELLGWMVPGFKKYSVKNIFASSFTKRKKFSLDTSLGGSKRAIVPVGTYEKVIPLDIIPTYLLRYLEIGDYEMAEKMGCMELLEEDLSLATFVCPGKIDHCKNLRNILNTIEKET